MNIQRLATDYERDGCIRIEGFLPPRRHAEVKARVEQYIHKVVPTVAESDRTFEADGINVRNMWRMEKYDPFFASLARSPEILELVGTLVHGTPLLHAVECFNKPAKTGSGVPAHQDNAYFCQSPPDILTVWIAMDAATLENGPIYYVKGSDRLGTLPHRPSGVRGNSFGLVEVPDHDKRDELCGTLNPGGALIHHSQTIHWSAPNTTDHSRCGLLLVYRGEHTHDDLDLKAAYQKAMSSVK